MEGGCSLTLFWCRSFTIAWSYIMSVFTAQYPSSLFLLPLPCFFKCKNCSTSSILTLFRSIFIFSFVQQPKRNYRNNKRNWENEARAEKNHNSIPLIKEAKRIMPILLAENLFSYSMKIVSEEMKMFVYKRT